MVQFMTFMVSYNNFMTQLTAKFPPIYYTFGAGFYVFIAKLGPSLQLLVGGLVIVNTLLLST